MIYFPFCSVLFYFNETVINFLGVNTDGLQGCISVIGTVLRGVPTHIFFLCGDVDTLNFMFS